MIGDDREPETSQKFNTVDGIAGFVQDNTNMYGEDVLFAREVPVKDTIVFSQADRFINRYLSLNNESSIFSTDYAVVITYNPVFHSNYQVIIATDFDRSFAVISIGEHNFLFLFQRLLWFYIILVFVDVCIFDYFHLMFLSMSYVFLLDLYYFFLLVII